MCCSDFAPPLETPVVAVPPKIDPLASHSDLPNPQQRSEHSQQQSHLHQNHLAPQEILCTAASLLWDPRFTSARRQHFLPKRLDVGSPFSPPTPASESSREDTEDEEGDSISSEAEAGTDREDREERFRKSRKITPEQKSPSTPVKVVTMDQTGKRHPSSFQQLEKLGEGTYATVRFASSCPLSRPHCVAKISNKTNQ